MLIVQTGLYIIQHRHIFKQTDILKCSCNTGLVDINRMQRRNVLPVEQDTSGIRLVYTGQQIEYRLFTGSVRSDQSVQLTILNCNIKSVYRAKSAKGNAQIFYFQHCHFIPPPLPYFCG